MNTVKIYFQDLDIFNHTSLFDVTYVAVVPCALA
jgi:hypothetical protein